VFERWLSWAHAIGGIRRRLNASVRRAEAILRNAIESGEVRVRGWPGLADLSFSTLNELAGVFPRPIVGIRHYCASLADF